MSRSKIEVVHGNVAGVVDGAQIVHGEIVPVGVHVLDQSVPVVGSGRSRPVQIDNSEYYHKSNTLRGIKDSPRNGIALLSEYPVAYFTSIVFYAMCIYAALQRCHVICMHIILFYLFA